MLRTLLAVLFALVLAGPAAAHPLSRDKWSLRTAIQLAGEKLDAVVVLEVPFDVVAKDVQADMEVARASANPAAAAREVFDRYTQRQWDILAAALTLTIDGRKVPGSWKPRDNRLNGKGAVTGGFFMYIVEFVPDGPLPLDGDVTVVVDDRAWPDAPMVYSALALAGDGWFVAKDSAAPLLPDRPYDLNAPDFWVDDPALRRFEVRFVRMP